MFTNNDPTLMAILVNVIFQKTKEPHLLVEKIDRAFSQTWALPEKRVMVEYTMAAWRTVSNWIWIGQTLGKSRKLFPDKLKPGKSGTAGFEASKRQALDRANAWSVPKSSRAKPRGITLGVERARRGRPIEPLITGEVVRPSGEHTASPTHEKASASSAVSEEHPVRETAGIRK